MSKDQLPQIDSQENMDVTIPLENNKKPSAGKKFQLALAGIALALGTVGLEAKGAFAQPNQPNSESTAQQASKSSGESIAPQVKKLPKAVKPKKPQTRYSGFQEAVFKEKGK